MLRQEVSADFDGPISIIRNFNGICWVFNASQRLTIASAMEPQERVGTTMDFQFSPLFRTDTQGLLMGAESIALTYSHY